jgi:peptide deformylase
MIQTLKYYPDTSINVNAGPVRDFKESYQLIYEDIVDTMKANTLSALSAIQIGHFYQLMVIKEGDDYVAYANPRIITQSDSFNSTEACSYFHQHPITVKRYQILSIIYEDMHGEMQTKKITQQEEAATFQRMLDYLFNTTLIDRLPPHKKEQASRALAGKGDMPSLEENAFCPPESKEVYFISLADKLLFFMFISLLLPLLNLSKETLSSWYAYDKIAFAVVFILMIGFFMFANYEAKKFKQCTSCQIGNNIGVIVKRMLLNFTLFYISYSIFHNTN